MEIGLLRILGVVIGVIMVILLLLMEILVGFVPWLPILLDDSFLFILYFIYMKNKILLLMVFATVALVVLYSKENEEKESDFEMWKKNFGF